MPLLQELESGLLLELAGGGLAEECCCNCLPYSLTINYTPQDCCCFDFSVSMSPPATTTIASYDWDFGDGTGSSSASPSHCYDEGGTYLVTLTTVDAEGCTKVTTVEVSCAVDPCPEDEGPVADFSYQQTSSDPCCFAFTDKSVVGEGCEGRTIVEWLWDFGDGTTSTSQNPTHCYEDAGPWDVALTVTDNFGCEDAVAMGVECEEFYGCADSDCTYPAPSVATATLAGYSDISGGPTCPECSDLNGIALELTNATGDACVWDCVVGGDPSSICVPCGEGPTLCASYPDSPAPGFPGNHPVQIVSSLIVAKLAPSNYRIEVNVAVNSCRNGTAQARSVLWRLDGLTTCPRGTYSVPYFSRSTGSVNNVCEHDQTSPISVTIP